MFLAVYPIIAQALPFFHNGANFEGTPPRDLVMLPGLRKYGIIGMDIYKTEGIGVIENLRDLGGTETSDGRIIRCGMLIRSANLFNAEETDLEGISTVIDLRTSGERAEAPDRVWGREYLVLPVLEDLTAGITRERAADEIFVPDMADLYRHLAAERVPALKRAVLAVMEHDFSSGAVLWHCSVGKDRCGLISALVLEALGVPRNVIMADYMKTNDLCVPRARQVYGRALQARGKDFAESVYRAYIADEKYLSAAWDALGPDPVRERLRIDEEQIKAFREKALLPAEGKGA